MGRAATTRATAKHGKPAKASAGKHGKKIAELFGGGASDSDHGESVQLNAHTFTSGERSFHPPIPCHAGFMIGELVKLWERRDRAHVAEGCEINEVWSLSPKERLTVVGLGELGEQIVPELFGFPSVFFDPLSGDDTPHDGKACPRIQALGKNTEFFDF